MDHFGFVEAVNSLGEGIVITVPDAADRGLDARRGKPLGILNRDVLDTAIAVVDEAPPRAGRRSCRACSSASSTKPA